VLEAVFILLEFSSPSRRIFIGSHSLPPSLVRRIGPSPVTFATVKGPSNCELSLFMKSYFPKASVEVVAGGLDANCTDEQYTELLEQMTPIAEQVAEKLNLQ
jgi:hypothetical protein